MSDETPKEGEKATDSGTEDLSSMRARQAKFLAAFSVWPDVSNASESAEIDRSCHYRWIREDATYKARFEDAHRAAADRAWGEAYRRGVLGVEKLKFANGMVIRDPYDPEPDLEKRRPYIEREYDGSMLGRILDRDVRYRERREVALTGPNGGPIQTQNVISDDVRNTANALMSDPKVAEALMLVGERLAAVRVEQTSKPSDPAPGTDQTCSSQS